MAVLNIPDSNYSNSNPVDIKDFLQERGIWFDQWSANVELQNDADQATILGAYTESLMPFMKKMGYETADVLNVHSETENLPAIRAKFLKEHTHTEDEIRFFVDGQGYFWFNLGNDEPIFNVLCQAGDLISVPPGISHWFDLGTPPFVKAIRVFTDQSGWVPHYTESGIDQKYNPKYDNDPAGV
ncbi:MAG: cupin [Bacteroidota bacterium]|nr:cupin [Bacteroidota bacterium]